jgi:hypothetical protein
MLAPLTPSQRSIVLQHVMDAIAQLESGSQAPPRASRPGGACDVLANLDPLIDIVRHTTATHVEAYQVQILEDVCEQCANQSPLSDCDVRRRDRCLLYANAGILAEAIAKALIEIRDPEYLKTHALPSGAVA